MADKDYERDDKDDKVIAELGLTEEQALFCELYLTSCHLSGGLAYKEAYGKEEVTNSCYTGASRLLKKSKARSYLKHLRERQKYESDITDDDLLRKLVEMLNTDITDVIEIISCRRPVINPETGKQDIDPETEEPIWELYKDFHIKDLNKLTKNQRLTISSLKMTREGMQFQLESKVKLAEMILKARGMFEHKQEIDVTQHVTINDNVDSRYDEGSPE